MFHVPAHKNVAAPAAQVQLQSVLAFGGHVEFVGKLSSGKAWSSNAAPDSFYVYGVAQLDDVVEVLKSQGFKEVL